MCLGGFMQNCKTDFCANKKVGKKSLKVLVRLDEKWQELLEVS